MRSSAIVAFITLAAVSPAFSAPVSGSTFAFNARRATTSSATPPPASTPLSESDALSLGTIGTIFSLGAPIVSGIIDHFKNNGDQQQRRQAEELESLFARADTDESDALSLGTIGTIFSLGAPVISGIIDHFKGNDNQSREFMELLARAEVDESGALKLGDAADIASIGSSIVSVFHNLFGGNSQQRRELMDIIARAEVDESGALKLPSFGTIANIGSIGGSAISILHNLFGGSDSDSQQQRRDLIDILSRAEIDESGALKLGDAADIASIGSSVVSVLHNLFGGNDSNQRRELMDILARAEVDDSGALKLPSFGTIANIGSLGGSAISILHNLFGGSSDTQQQRRDLMEILARAEVDESGALKLPSLSSLAGIAGIGGGAASILESLFGGSSDSQQQRRDLMEILARAEVDESGALKLPSLSSLAGIASIGGGAVSILHSLFGGSSDSQQQRRELAELLARAEVDESGALKFPSLSSLAGIASIGSGAAGILHSLFGGSSDNQQQRREVIELLTRELSDDQSDALSLGTIGTIFSLGAPVISGIIDHFKGNDNQRREFMDELVARGITESDALSILRLIPIIKGVSGGTPQTRSLNDLD